MNARFDVEYAINNNFGIKSLHFELPLSIRFKTLGFQDQEAWTLVENEQRSVRIRYVSSGIFASVQDSTPNKLQRITSSSKSCVLSYLFNFFSFEPFCYV